MPHKESPHEAFGSRPGAADLRDTILKRMGPLENGFYPADAVKMLAAYEARLREGWEFGARLEFEARLLETVRSVVATWPHQNGTHYAR